MSKKYDITVAGLICLDIIPDIPGTGFREISEILKPGKLLQVNAAKISSGGPVSNTGFALSKLGLNVAFMARIGDDPFGQLLQNLISSQGQTPNLAISARDRTSYTIVIAPPGIDRIFMHDPGANSHFSSSDLKPAVIANSRLFHFGYPSIMEQCYINEGRELRLIMQTAKNTGAITSLDMSLPDPGSESGKAPWKKILKNVLPYVDIFIPSIEEVFFMLDPAKYDIINSSVGQNNVIDSIDPADYFRLAEECLNLGAKIVALKTAHRGYYILTADLQNKSEFIDNFPGDWMNWSNRELWCPAYSIEKIASATGSGDSSIAGFIAALSRGYSVEQTLKFAVCVGFQNLHELDALSGIRTWEDTQKMVADTSMPRIELSLDPSQWRWEREFNLYIGAGDKNF